MTHRPPTSTTQGAMLAALTGGCAAIIGGFVFTGGLLVLDVQGLQTLAAQDGWTRPLLQLGGVVGAFGILGFAMGPVVAALGNPSGRKRPKGRHSGR